MRSGARRERGIAMCQRVNCRQCGRPTYKGCGMHVEQVLANVPVSERCQCREKTGKPAAGERRSWLRDLLSR